MKHFYENQFHYACGVMLIGLLVLTAGTSWKYSSFYYALDDDRLLRLVVPLLLITSLAWLTDFTVDKVSIRGRAVFWYLLNGALTIPLVGWSVLAVADSVNDKYGTNPHLDTTPLIFFAVVVALFCATAWAIRTRVHPVLPPVAEFTVDERKDQPKPADGEDDLYGRWGKVASLIIMILALYAFGLRRELGSGELKVHWEEVPAILVVFVLAELGVHLVVRARRIQTGVGQSSELANKAVEEAHKAVKAVAELSKNSVASAEALQEKMTLIEQQGSALVDKLQRVSEESAANLKAVEVEYRTFLERLVPLEESGCYAASNSLYKQLGMESLDYWKTITTFAQSWDPLAEEKPGTQKLLRVLFSSYVGDTVEKGSIRRQDNSIACITADAIFAEVSEKWLDVMLKMATRESPLVVWAVTKLLPTEFALPGVWLGTDERDEKAPRVQSLERFISSVLKACQRDQAEVEYRRVTVFENAGYRRASEEVDGSPWKPSGMELLSNSLDNWMLWDPRIQPPYRDGADFNSVETLLRALLWAYGKRDKIRSEKILRWSSLNKFFKDNIACSVGNDATGTLPRLPASDGTEVVLFQYEFSSAFSETRANEEARPISGPRMPLSGGTGAVLGGSKEFLDHRFEWKDIPQGIGVEPREKLRTLLSNGSKSARELLETIGWQSVKKWYCQNLHNGEEAWWTVMDEKNTTYFDPLRLKWNGASVLTLDLLLIGRRVKNEIDWQGAAISNLSFDRTECTIQLIAKSTGLKQIGEVVEGLCAGRGGSDHGKWKDWPVSLSSRVASEGTT